jgi:uncharacterized protein
MNPLTAVEARVLGSLFEKDVTTPDYYPMTLKALTNACNQSSNRNPVVSFAERDVVLGLDSLREKRLAFMFQGAESRVPKYGHRFPETFGLGRPEAAVMCVLLLRGPQTAGEIRGRTGRMHEFASLEDTAATLDALAARAPDPLVLRLPRQAGFKEQRYAHLLSGEVRAPVPGTEPVPEPAASAPEDERLARLEAEATALRAELAELRQQLADLKGQLG